MKQLGQHPAPRHTVAHLSDPRDLLPQVEAISLEEARELASSKASPFNLGDA